MTRFLPIDDADDPRIEVFRAIRDRDVTGRSGFIAEGTVVVEQLLCSSRFVPTGLLILGNRLAGLGALLSRVPHDIPIYTAEKQVFDRIAGFPMHRGVLAHGKARDIAERTVRSPLAVDLAALAAAEAMVVVAVGIANHDNMGAIFRNAAAFGAALVILDETSCDPLYRKAIRVSAGSVLHLRFERLGTGDDALNRLQKARFGCLALSPKGRIRLESASRSGPVALFLGAEGPGLSPGLMARMETIRIAMAPGFDSLNVATSAAIALHHLTAGAKRSD